MLIVQGVFRSGTTMLFRALRQDPRLRCYYEPLHPNLLDHVREATADCPNHVKSPLYAEFTSLGDSMESLYDATLALQHAALGPQDAAPTLRTYLQALTASAPQVILQFNRSFWMTRWLHCQYPDSTFVHVVRDPRSVVWSQLTTASGQRVRMDWPLLGRRFFNFSSGNLRNVFSPYAYCGGYQIKDYMTAGRRLEQTFQDDVAAWAQTQLRAVQDAPPFVQALALWGAQVRVSHHHARNAFGNRYRLLRYEDLCRHPKRTLRGVYAGLPHAMPPPVDRYVAECIHAQRLTAWHTVDEAEAHFRDGIRRAGIEPVLREVGYTFDHISSLT